LAIWHDIAEAGEADYNRWHTRQHMAERLGIPGFLCSRRYAGPDLKKERYFTFYEAATLEVFNSDGYRARLNTPSAWSMRTQPHHVNFVRSACMVGATVGRGYGGAMGTVRIESLGSDRADFEAAAEPMAATLLAMDGVTGVHVGFSMPSVTNVRTEETRLRKDTSEGVFAAVIMVEGIGRNAVEQVMPKVQSVIRAVGSPVLGPATVYDLAYLLLPEGGA
jgi:hypothetical protein